MSREYIDIRYDPEHMAYVRAMRDVIEAAVESGDAEVITCRREK